MSTTVTSKGQVTIPKRIRDVLGVKPGSAVDFILDKDGRVIVSPVRKKRLPPIAPGIAKVRGRLKGGPSTNELMALLRGED
jgi:AbrB family looped-hinge helix DNA binding protein